MDYFEIDKGRCNRLRSAHVILSQVVDSGVAELMYDVAIETHKQYSKQGGIFCYINS
jgi:hypothetical protein